MYAIQAKRLFLCKLRLQPLFTYSFLAVVEQIYEDTTKEKNSKKMYKLHSAHPCASK